MCACVCVCVCIIYMYSILCTSSNVSSVSKYIASDIHSYGYSSFFTWEMVVKQLWTNHLIWCFLTGREQDSLQDWLHFRHRFYDSMLGKRSLKMMPTLPTLHLKTRGNETITVTFLKRWGTSSCQATGCSFRAYHSKLKHLPMLFFENIGFAKLKILAFCSSKALNRLVKGSR